MQHFRQRYGPKPAEISDYLWMFVMEFSFGSSINKADSYSGNFYLKRIKTILIIILV